MTRRRARGSASRYSAPAGRSQLALGRALGAGTFEKFRGLWRTLSVTDVARRIHVAPRAVEGALRSAEGRARVKQRLAATLGVPADRLNIQKGPTGAVLIGDVWLEVPVAGGWVAASRLVVQVGRLVVGEVRVFPDDGSVFRREEPGGRWSAEVLGIQAPVPPGGLTARTLLHRVRLGQHPRHLRDVLRFIHERHGPDAFAPGGSLAALGLAPMTERPRVRRQFGRDDYDYAVLARAYDRLVNDQQSRRPNADIAARRRELLTDALLRDLTGLTGARVVAVITAWLHEARQRGILAPKDAKQGRSEGRLTAFGRRVLRDAERDGQSPIRRGETRRQRRRTTTRQQSPKTTRKRT